jgi:multidrug transporter EmrE-like cation transporter
MRTFGLLIIAITMSFFGETMLKKGINDLRDGGALDKFQLSPGPMVQTAWNVFTNPFVFFGFVLIFGGSIFWLAVIADWPLSLAYPLLSLNYLFIVGASYFYFHEEINWLEVAGVLVIIAGVALLFMGYGQTNGAKQ